MLRVETQRSGADACIRLDGELDIEAAGDVERALESLEEEGIRLLLDVSSLSFIDSSGIRVLIWADRRGRENGHEFAIRAGDGVARERLRRLCLEDELPLLD